MHTKYAAFYAAHFVCCHIFINGCCIFLLLHTRLKVNSKCFPSGYYGEGLNAIIVFSACYLPDSSSSDYHYIMENLFL